MIDSFPATREQIIARHPLLEYCKALGWELKKRGRNWECLCPLHDDKNPSFKISETHNVWKCFGCDTGGSVIDLHAKLNNCSIGDAMRDLWPEETTDSWLKKERPREAPPAPVPAPNGNGNGAHEVAAYHYHDATGRVVFDVVRFDPKDFRQCRICEGKRVWSMEGVERIPYHLPELLAHPTSVWVVEGEKDAEILHTIGQIATCNPGGAGKWLPAFSQYLTGQCVYICPDRDEPGMRHGKQVLKSLEGICQWAKWIELPPEHQGKPIKDVADLRMACRNIEEFIDVLHGLQQRARLIEKGIECDSFTGLEMESDYIGENTRFNEVSLRLQNWMPSINVRSLGPGDVLGIIAGTGQLKTAVAQNILAANPNLPALFFQLELSSAAMFERMASIATGIDASEIQRIYQSGGRVDWQTSGKFKNLLVHTANVNMRRMDEEIARASAKLGRLPKVFVIDYVQLVSGTGSRYERVSEACEQTKRLAKKWNVIAILVSQISRKPEDADDEVKLHDAKESGSFENSCGVVLGIWKTSPQEMSCKVLKNTKGRAGKIVKMQLRENTFIIEPAV